MKQITMDWDLYQAELQAAKEQGRKLMDPLRDACQKICAIKSEPMIGLRWLDRDLTLDGARMMICKAMGWGTP